jgi:hypothetical protein
MSLKTDFARLIRVILELDKLLREMRLSRRILEENGEDVSNFVTDHEMQMNTFLNSLQDGPKRQLYLCVYQVIKKWIDPSERINAIDMRPLISW